MADVPMIVIGVPSLGLVSIPWHARMLHFQRPTNTNLGPVYEVGLPVADARNNIVRHFLSMPKATHLFFVDDDVLIPLNALVALWNHRKPMVAGLYYTKSTPAEPLVYLENGSGAFLDFTRGDVVPCLWHGMGCTLIVREVFEKTAEIAPKDDKGRPVWFKTITNELMGDGTVYSQTEDFHFCALVHQAGFPTYVDTSVFCWHWDKNTRMAYPLPEWKQEMGL